MSARAVRASEQGAALFAVLAMVMLLAGFATLGLQRLRAASDRVVTAEALGEAQLLANAGGAAALAVVAQIKARQRVAGPSAGFGAPVAIDLGSGRITLTFRDAGACFNLNSLVPPPRAAGAAGIAATAQARPDDLARLLVAVGIPPVDASRLARQTAERLAATGLIWADPGEWTSVPGVTAAHWNAARPFLCTLPNREASAINVNGLGPEQAPLLVALGVSPDAARRVLARRPAEGWASANQFWSEALPAGAPEGAGAQVVGTSSRWVALDILADTPRARVRRELLLDTVRTPARIASSRWGMAEVRA